jgi:hypothetical protein
LAQLAKLVDFHGSHEALEPFLDIWIHELRSELKGPIPDLDLIHWLCMASVFRKAEELQVIAKVIRRYGCDIFQPREFPISGLILGWSSLLMNYILIS